MSASAQTSEGVGQADGAHRFARRNPLRPLALLFAVVLLVSGLVAAPAQADSGSPSIVPGATLALDVPLPDTEIQPLVWRKSINIVFKSGSSQIQPKVRKKIQKVVKQANAVTGSRSVTITANPKSQAAGRKLALQRARALQKTVKSLKLQGTVSYRVRKIAKRSATTASTRTTLRAGPAAATMSFVVTPPSALKTPLMPAFGPITRTADGFVVAITNFDAAWDWTASATAGVASIDGQGLLTVTGLAGNQTVSVGVVTKRSGFIVGTGTVGGSALPPPAPTTASITFSSGSQGTVAGCTPTYEPGTAVTPTCAIVTPNPGYEFDGFVPAVIPTTSTGPVTITVQWRQTQYQITYEANGGTLGGCTPTTYTTSTEAIPWCATKIPPAPGYLLAGYSPATIPAGSTGNVTVTAQWTNVFTITYLSGAHGTVSGCTPATYTFGVGAPNPTCTTVTPHEGWEFDGFDIGIGLIATGNKTLTAKWAGLPQPVVYDSDGGEPVPSATAPNGSNWLTLAPAAQRTGKSFIGWQLTASGGSPVTDGQILGAGGKYTGTIPIGGVTFTALWGPIDCASSTVGQVGQGGGVVFYQDLNQPVGTQCLEYTPNWQANQAWAAFGCWTTEVPNTSNSGIGLGAINTANLVAAADECAANTPVGQASPPQAAMQSDAYVQIGSGKDDWYLSSALELNQLCRFIWGQPTGPATLAQNCKTEGGTPNSTTVPGFENGWYWSSTRSDSTKTVNRHFGSGVQSIGGYSIGGSWARPIRSY